LLLLLVVLSAAAARAQTSPEAAARHFYESAAQRNYLDCWNLLTSSSQKSFVQAVAPDAKMDPTLVRQLFAANDPRLVAGFWESFRKALHPDQILKVAHFKTESDDGRLAKVRLDDRTVLLMFKEGGSWKLGWQETFQPSMGYLLMRGRGGS
jgi:hypothetical protein